MDAKIKTNKVRSSERGQAIILMVLLITGLVAIAGLAVDGGRLYYSQRTAQNAADNAALAAAWAACSGGNVNNIAFASALTNGYDNDGSTNTMNVNRPPNSGPNVGDNEYIEVVINSVEEAGFSQLVFSGSLESTVRAVGRCNPGVPGPVGSGYGIIALDDDDDKAFSASGNGSITVSGGGIFVNSNDNDKAMYANGNAEIIAVDGIDVVGGYSTTGNADITPNPGTGAAPMPDPLAALPAPPNPGGSCNNYSLNGNGTDTIDPGLYCQISVSANGVLTMNPGIYYIDSGNFSVSGNGDLDADGVMIYLTQGSFSITGNGDINISAPSSGTYAGMMLFMDQSNTSDIKITGNGVVDTDGTIYGASAELELSGNGNNTVLNAQIIVSTVDVTGNGALALNYNSEDVYQSGAGVAQIELAE